MGKDKTAVGLVKQGGKAEKQLLRKERRAERLLTEARARLQKAQIRLERRLSAVSDAEALLRTRQAARGAGPSGSNGASVETVPAASASATDEVAQNGAVAEAEASAAKPAPRRRTRRPAAAKEASA